VIEYPTPMQSTIHVYEVLLQVPSYIPGGAWSFWKLIGLLLQIVGCLIALWLIWVGLRWVVRSLRRRFAENDMHAYEVRPRKDKRGIDLISDALPFGRLWYAGPNATGNAVGYAKHHSRSHDAVIRVCDKPGNVIETHEHRSEFKEW
jgi:hypothetical protein